MVSRRPPLPIIQVSALRHREREFSDLVCPSPRTHRRQWVRHHSIMKHSFFAFDDVTLMLRLNLEGAPNPAPHSMSGTTSATQAASGNHPPDRSLPLCEDDWNNCNSLGGAIHHRRLVRFLQHLHCEKVFGILLIYLRCWCQLNIHSNCSSNSNHGSVVLLPRHNSLCRQLHANLCSILPSVSMDLTLSC